MHNYIDYLVEQNDYIWLLEEKNRVLDIISDIKERINNWLKEERQLVEHEELLEYIKQSKLKLLSLTK